MVCHCARGLCIEATSVLSSIYDCSSSRTCLAPISEGVCWWMVNTLKPLFRMQVARYAWAVLQKNTPRLAKWMLTHETLGSNAADLSVKNSEMVQNLWEKVLCG